MTNCVAPVASETRTSTGFEKNMRQVGQKAAFAGVLADSPLAPGVSRPPRTGSRTTSSTITAVMMPTAPRQMNAERQLYAAAIDAPNATPSASPIGGPRLKRLSAVPRVPGGK